MTLDAWIDESAGKGLISRLEESKDQEFALFAALLITTDERDAVATALRPAFEHFSVNAPPTAKLHITDAFATKSDGTPENPEWMEAATTAREQIFQVLPQFGARVVYAARRFGVARTMDELSQGLRLEAKRRAEEHYQTLSFPQMRASSERVDTQAFRDLILLLHTAAVNFSSSIIQPRLDRVDQALLNDYEAATRETKLEKEENVTAKAWDIVNKKAVSSSWTYKLSAPSHLTEGPLGEIKVEKPIIEHDVGPELFAIDVIANALAKHLKERPATENLYGPEATFEWAHKELLTQSNHPDARFFGLT